MGETGGSGRPNQRRRTRKDLLQAAARLLQRGRTPTLDEVAEEALVSRATAYRYFPGVEALLVEAAVDVAVPEAEDLFTDRFTADPAARLERVDAALHEAIIENEVPLRLMLARSLEQGAKRRETNNLPLRQNRRTPLIEAALAPARKHFKRSQFETLKAALALIIGTEGMLVFRDVLQMREAEALKVKRWAIRALVEAALQQSKAPTDRTG